MECIVAYDKNKGLSKNGKMPWNLPEDMKFFKSITSKNVVIMGKNTFESLNFIPLKNRLNVVLTRNPEELYHFSMKYYNLIITNNENIHFDIIRNNNEYANRFEFLNKHFKIIYIGGEQIYAKFIPLCSTIWITQINEYYDCDLFFSFDIENNFSFISECQIESEKFKIIKYTKTNS